MHPPTVVVFDVNETLSDLAPLQQAFADAGAPPTLAHTWFTGVLRDGFALTAVGASAPFAQIARDVLRGHLHDEPGVDDVDAAVERLMSRFATLEVHPDVPVGVRLLASRGVRLVTLSNGAAELAEGLLGRAGLRDAFEHVLSVQPSGTWKPASAAYEEAARATGVPLEQMMLVAVHPWDVDGARRAGMRAAWVDRRRDTPYPRHFTAPEVTVAGVDDLAGRLG